MSKKIAENLPGTAKLAAIRFLVLDVDGVMTDGSISYDSAGHELKTFNVKDGAGLGYWKQAGHEAGIITGRSSPMLERRARELGIRFVAMGAPEKMPAFEKMLAEAGVAPEETAVVGDDLPDLPLIRRAGFGVAVADAAAEARLEADWVARQNGGRGAVREVIELILKARGEWDGVLARHR
ncbi:MAG: HAD hydrolase family protein [Planctomycetota bacterium]|jgi:3-deoxy-D-manno-octulosonate 8-phosphate phosphatase (KDO 8-P phosphatase)|nr:HAD hydrolase family protein [Planctomycetota bacterium]